MTNNAAVSAVLNEIDAVIVGAVGTKMVTRGELSRLFTALQNAEHWKLPVDATVTADMVTAMVLGDNIGNDRAEFEALIVSAIRQAVVFFTGSVPTVTRRGNTFHVRAAGYFAAIGA